MTVTITQAARNLREELAMLREQIARGNTETFWFSGNGSTTSFALPKGWKPKQVFVNGVLFRPGTGEDYTTSFDGFVTTVVMAVAPSTVDVASVAQRES